MRILTAGLFLILLVVTLAGNVLCTGCVRVPAAAPMPGQVAPSFVTRALDELLPPDFHGDAAVSQRGQYLTIEIEAGDLRRDPRGFWSWAWLTYERHIALPFFFGVQWKHEGKVRLGPSSRDPRPAPPPLLARPAPPNLRHQ